MGPVHLVRTIAVAALVVVSASAPLRAANAPSSNVTFPSLSLPASDGTRRALDSLRGKQGTVVILIGVDCPLSRLYLRRIGELATHYTAKSFGFIVVDPNPQDSLAELANIARETPGVIHLKDEEQKLAGALGALRVPEVFLFDRTGALRYRGRVDDQFSVGVRRPRASAHYLRDALDAVMAGRRVEKPVTDAVGCLIDRPRVANPDGSVTWSRDISRIFQKRCQSCHRPGQPAPFSLMTHADTVGWLAMIGEVIEERRMPPWGASGPAGQFANDCRLTDEEREKVRRWIEAGGPGGDPRDAPPPVSFPKEWQLSREPDLVLTMSDKPYRVPAEGVIPYQYFIVDSGLSRDRWILSAECRPGDPSVVHHASVFILPADADPRMPADRLGELWKLQQNLICSYAPGIRPVIYPDGLATRLPAGSKIVFQVHYSPTGVETEDCCRLGLVLAEEGKSFRPITTIPIVNPWFEIPPGAPDYQVIAEYPLREDSIALAYFPHMHLRGRAFRYEVIPPSGAREVLLDAPRYEFEWQMRYALTTPRRLPAGSLVRCVATYDNSAANPRNPDPAATVRWGDQSDEEMMIGYLEIAPDDRASRARSAPVDTAKWIGLAVFVASCVASAGLFWPRRRSSSGPSLADSPP